MSSLVLGFQEIEKTQLFLVGGKGLKLGELSKIHEIQVPKVFCVTTEAYQKALEAKQDLPRIVGSTKNAKFNDPDQIGEISRKIRQIIMEVEIPSDVAGAVAYYLSSLRELRLCSAF